jgi:hypothetical protein
LSMSSMMTGKKTVAIGPVRVTEEAFKEYKKALAYFDINRASFCRMCIDALIRSYQAGTELELPIAFVLGPTREARRAVEKLGIDIPTFREELSEDIIRIADSGEKIALPGRLLTVRERDILARASTTKTKIKKWH